MLIYVLLHEFSHFLNKNDIGHTAQFHKIFEDLIAKAHDMGIYNASIPPVEKYCMSK
jgi:predicted metal-dependent hydrolase